MKSNPRHGKSAFTLIELMAVITIIVILAGLVVGGLGYVTEKQAKSKALVQIALISKALEAYKLDIGMYPPTTTAQKAGNGTSAQSLYISLFYEGYDYGRQASPPATWTKKIDNVNIPKATTIYLPDLDPTTSKQGWVDSITGTGTKVPPASTLVKDPYAVEYRYRSARSAAGTANTDTQNPDFDLWSCGKDGVTIATLSSTQNRDDIKNF